MQSKYPARTTQQDLASFPHLLLHNRNHARFHLHHHLCRKLPLLPLPSSAPSNLTTGTQSALGLANAIPTNATVGSTDADWPVVDATSGDWSTSCTKDFNPPADGNTGTAVTTEIGEGIKYLRRIGGQPLENNNVCARVSCSWKSAIYWCNEEKDHGLRLKSFGDIADGAEAILNNCQKGSATRGKATTGSDGKKWSVVVVKAGC